MNKFDENIRKKLDEAPEHPPDQNMWEGIDQQLHPQIGFGRGVWTGLAIVAALLLTGWFGFLLGNKSQMRKKSSVSVNNENGNIVDRYDTVYLRDTIVLSVPASHRSEMIEGSNHFPDLAYLLALQQSTVKISKRFDFKEKFLTTPERMRELLVADMATRINLTDAIPMAEQSTKSHDQHQNQQVSHLLPRVGLLANNREFHLPPRFRKLSLHPYIALNAEEIIAQGRKQRILKTLLPDRFRLGVHSGWHMITNHDWESAVEWSAGVSFEAFFSPRFSLASGFSYRYLYGKIEADEARELPYPTPETIQAGDDIHEIYIDHHFYQIPLFASYYIPIQNRLAIQIRLGSGLNKMLKQRYEFEVFRQNDEVKISTETSGSTWQFNSWLAGVGVEYQVHPRLSTSMLFDGRHQFKTSSGEYDPIHHIGAQIGLRYSF